MDSLRPWVAAARPERALLAPVCVAVGSSYAHLDAQPGPGFPGQILITIAAFAAALGVNLVDHAWDRSTEPPPDSEAAGASLAPDVGAVASAIAGAAMIALSALCGIALASLSGSAALGYGAVAVLLGIARRTPAVGLETLGWGLGEVAYAVALGPLAALAGFASQAGSGSTGAFLAGCPPGLVAAASLVAPRRSHPTLDEDAERSIAVAVPLSAAGAIAIAARFWEYGAWAGAAALPMIVIAVASWRSPRRPEDADVARSQRVALACAVVALVWIVAVLRILSGE